MLVPTRIQLTDKVAAVFSNPCPAKTICRIVAGPHDEFVSVAAATRNPKDRPNPRMGNSIALARALDWNQIHGTKTFYRALADLPVTGKGVVRLDWVLRELAESTRQKR